MTLTRKLFLLWACATVGFVTAQQSLQIVGIQEEDCGLSPNLYQTRPVLTVCMAESAPFLVRRQLYVPTSGKATCVDESEQNNTEDVDESLEQFYDSIKKVLDKSPSTGYPVSADDFHKLYNGYDADLLLAVLSSGVFRNHDYEVKMFSTPSAAMYGLRMEQCDFALSGLVHVGAVTTEDSCESVQNNATASLDYYGTCPTVSGETAPTLENACCLDYSTWYKRWGPAVLSKQQPKQAQAALFFANISKPDPIKILCSVVLSLLLSGHLVWFFERRSNSIQFPEDYGTGVDHGLWWSVVTMATVGYGDKAPVTLMGRLLGVAWMFIGIMMLGYFSGIMVEGYVDPPPRFIAFNTWLDIREHYDKTGVQFCTIADTFFRTTLEQHGLASESSNLDGNAAIKYTGTMDQCYGLLLEDKVAGVVANKPHLHFDAVKSDHNSEHPLSKCDDMVVSAVIEPVYHSLAVRKAGTFPGDFSKNLKCSLDIAIGEFEDGATLFSRPDLPNGPSYTSQDASLLWFRDDESGDYVLLGANEIDSSDATEAYALLCATLLAYAIMLVALWVTRYRRARVLKMALRSKDSDEPTLIPKSRMARFTADFTGDDDDIQHLTSDPGNENFLEMENGNLPAGPVSHQAMRLNEDRLITICEQLSDLRLMIKRLENQQAGIQMPRAKPKKSQAGKSYREIDPPNAPDH